MATVRERRFVKHLAEVCERLVYVYSGSRRAGGCFMARGRGGGKSESAKTGGLDSGGVK